MKLERYREELQERWDTLVSESRNATFLHYRDYMDYHRDRFSDFSLLAFDDAGKLKAVLPASRVGERVYSHQGLTYGGWLLPRRRCDQLDMLEIWECMLDYLHQAGVRELIYKPVPHIYHRSPAQEDLFGLYRSGGEIQALQVSSTIDLRNPISIDSGAARGVSKARRAGVSVRESEDYGAFWSILTALLRSKYEATPVHSIEEMQLLRSRFPNNIRLYGAYDGEGELLAGTVIYECGVVAHCQYIASTERGREMNGLKILFQELIEYYKGKAWYFDFGTSNLSDPRELNKGLIRQKTSMGARTVIYPTYRLRLV